MTDHTGGFEGYAVLEILGRRELAGWVSEQEIAGQAFVRIDIPGAEGDVATQFFAPSAVYAITPTTEEIARVVAVGSQPRPVTQWEPRAIAAARSATPTAVDDPPWDDTDKLWDDPPWDDDEEPF